MLEKNIKESRRVINEAISQYDKSRKFIADKEFINGLAFEIEECVKNLDKTYYVLFKINESGDINFSKIAENIESDALNIYIPIQEDKELKDKKVNETINNVEALIKIDIEEKKRRLLDKLLESK